MLVVHIHFQEISKNLAGYVSSLLITALTCKHAGSLIADTVIYLQKHSVMGKILYFRVQIWCPGELAPSLAKIPCCIVSKIITKIMYVHIKLSIDATIQFEIHPRC